MITMQGKYQTRDGRAVRILCADAMRVFSVIGLIKNPDGTERSFAWQSDGGAGEGLVGVSDLIPTPTKHEGWVVFDKSIYGVYSSKEVAEAVMGRSNQNVVIAHVTWED